MKFKYKVVIYRNSITKPGDVIMFLRKRLNLTFREAGALAKDMKVKKVDTLFTNHFDLAQDFQDILRSFGAKSSVVPGDKNENQTLSNVNNRSD